MLYYRYRSGSELSIKELIYDELYWNVSFYKDTTQFYSTIR